MLVKLTEAKCRFHNYTMAKQHQLAGNSVRKNYAQMLEHGVHNEPCSSHRHELPKAIHIATEPLHSAQERNLNVVLPNESN
jgi:hypothetical protein